MAGGTSSGELDELLKKIKDLERSINDKLDCDVFDNEIAALRAMIGNMDDKQPTSIQTTAPVARPAGPSLSTKDLNRIKEILEKFPSIEETQQKILK